ncbi:uncharacterized protein LOC124163232 [Ischnura elegans]|uniref:uncharacterized protein LOC124163232 n=1 Tax=Ischnura elegans TaxID=197161 RepID=UPI001ED88122|nr:uncharacterized protein LOC124163232 [Ischnura elegans]
MVTYRIEQILEKFSKRDMFMFGLLFGLVFTCLCWIIPLGASGYFNPLSTRTDGHGTDVLDLQGKESVFNSSIEADFITNVKRHNESCRIQCTTEDLRLDKLGVELDPPTGEYCKCPEISGCCVDPHHILKPTGYVTVYREYKVTDQYKNTRLVKMPFTNPSGCECRPTDD